MPRSGVANVYDPTDDTLPCFSIFFFPVTFLYLNTTIADMTHLENKNHTSKSHRKKERKFDVIGSRI